MTATGSAGVPLPRRAVGPVLAFWQSSVGKKAVMAVTGLIWVAYLITHVLANLLVFSGPTRINAYSAFLHSTGLALWVPRLILMAALVLHIVAAYQLARRRQAARPVGYVQREPQVSTFASRTIRWGGVLILIFIIIHLLQFTTGTILPGFIEGDPYRNVLTGFHNPVVVVFYLIALAALGLHLYHGVWSSGRSLGAAPAEPNTFRRPVAVVLAVFIWLGFTIIPIAVFFGWIGGPR
ncbi:MAG TPA: succinate dehydrogenase cytochrome b subunit [Gemmatimonadales bacterium]|nr:succinate dehydrogenase cytochrome b subunit [Gemmatimonadales bacterium]